MSTHELAKILLENPDVPVVTFVERKGEGWFEETAGPEFDTREYRSVRFKPENPAAPICIL